MFKFLFKLKFLGFVEAPVGVFHIIFKMSHPNYTSLVEMLNASGVGMFSIMLEMSECSIHNDEVVESQLKNSQYHFMLFQIKFSKKKIK